MRARMTFKIRAGLRVAQVNRTGKIVETSSLYVSRNLRIKRLIEAQRSQALTSGRARGLGRLRPGKPTPAYRRPPTNIAPT